MVRKLLLLLLFFATACSNVNVENKENVNLELQLEKQPEITVSILKIGKADTMLISYEDTHILLDTGEEDDGEEINQFLRNKNIKSLDYVILSHFDKDHIGGADQVLSSVEVKQLLVPSYVKESKQYEQLLEVVAKQRLEAQRITSKETISINDFTMQLIPATKTVYKQENDYSLVVSVTYKNTSFLFAGDAEEERLQELMATENVQHTFLKVPHHGRYNDASEAFFNTVQAEVAVITDSDKNPADEQTLTALKNAGTMVYHTRNGNITITSNGDTLSVQQ